MSERFFSIYNHGFARVAACTPQVAVADPVKNYGYVVELLDQAEEKGAAVALFPELCLTGYAIDDLVQQEVILEEAIDAISKLVGYSHGRRLMFAVGAPLKKEGRLYNCAVVIQNGQILGVVPKTYLPTYREFYDRRYYASGAGLVGEIIQIGDLEVPFGTDILFRSDWVEGLEVHVEICEDFWTPIPPSTYGALAGATVLLNLSASNITIGKGEARRMLCQSQSARSIAAYAYSAAGPGESTTDLAWDGQALICENGDLLVESERFTDGGRMIVADIDLDRLLQERMRTGTFSDTRQATAMPNFRRVSATGKYGANYQAVYSGDIGFERPIDRFPYVPSDPRRLAEDCFEAYNIQVNGLVQRLKSSKFEKIVLGVSGGLDSTQALIVAARAMDLLGYPRTNILGFSLPGFATGDKTRKNAHALMDAFGITAEEVDISKQAMATLEDLGHPFAKGEPVYDVTFENAQAGARTSFLFRAANQRRAIVLGTGDMSELALGWCTYGVGDQMSHYGVNSGVVKTLIQYLIGWVAGQGIFSDKANETLLSILGTEISPELIPAGADGLMQSTQSIIGPYALQDFNLFYTLRRGYRPTKTAFLAWQAWGAGHGSWPSVFPEGDKGDVSLAEIKKWLGVFLDRFFGSTQFKRTAMPNGPKVSAGGSLSPRGDWRAPSDSAPDAWLRDLDKVPDAVEAPSLSSNGIELMFNQDWAFLCKATGSISLRGVSITLPQVAHAFRIITDAKNYAAKGTSGRFDFYQLCTGPAAWKQELFLVASNFYRKNAGLPPLEPKQTGSRLAPVTVTAPEDLVARGATVGGGKLVLGVKVADSDLGKALDILENAKSAILNGRGMIMGVPTWGKDLYDAGRNFYREETEGLPAYHA